MNIQPYLGCAWLKPTKKNEEDGELPNVVVDLCVVLAKDESTAIAKILRKAPRDVDDNRLEVRVRPF